jgi:hypothetical protein
MTDPIAIHLRDLGHALVEAWRREFDGVAARGPHRRRGRVDLVAGPAPIIDPDRRRPASSQCYSRSTATVSTIFLPPIVAVTVAWSSSGFGPKLMNTSFEQF